MNNKTVTIFTILAFALGGVFYILYPTPNEYEASKDKGGQVACTQEARVCSDGSYVGREGPNCEFAPCPTPPGTKMEDGTIPE